MLRQALVVLAATAIGAAASAQAPGAAMAATSPEPIMQAVDCGLWLSSVQRCARPDADLTLPMVAGRAGFDAPGAVTTGGDAGGLRRDTYYFVGLQFSIIAVLYVMPESVSGWSDEQRNQHHASKWWHNVTHPSWDSDDDYINYVLHPYWGGTYYVRARERGYGPRGAFWYSFLLSTLYEAGAEALFEEVSVQDFFVTPIVGSWVGSHFMRWREGAKSRMAEHGPRFRDRTVLVLTDPLGNTADLIDRRLGRDVDVALRPFATPVAPGRWHDHDSAAPAGIAYGIKLEIAW